METSSAFEVTGFPMNLCRWIQNPPCKQRMASAPTGRCSPQHRSNPGCPEQVCGECTDSDRVAEEGKYAENCARAALAAGLLEVLQY